MALIKCVECGKEFSDKAPTCPNCGCPTEYVLSSVDNIEEKEVIAKYDIFGYNFEIDTELDYRIKVVSDFNRRYEQIEDLAEIMYYKLENIDRVMEELPEYLSDFLESAVIHAVETLTSNGVFDCDVQFFMKKYGELLDASTIMEPVITRYLEILNLKDEINTYHKYLRESRKNAWQGGGFGIKGALKGYFKAQMLNAGTSFVTSFSDNKMHQQNLQEVLKAKKRLYEDENTKQAVVDAVLNIFVICNTKMFEELQSANKIGEVFFETEKAARITNNLFQYLNRGNKPDIDVVIKQCLQAFILDPTYQEIINFMISLQEDSWDDPGEEGLYNYAKDYGFFKEYSKKVISKFKDDYADDINKFKSSVLLPMHNYDIYNNVFHEYWSLLLKFREECPFVEWVLVVKELDLDKYIKKALMERISYDLEEDEFYEISSLEDVVKDHEKKQEIIDRNFSEEMIDYFKIAIQLLKNKRIIDYDRFALLRLVNKICASHSNDSICPVEDGFYFSNKTNIEKIEHYKTFIKDAKIPTDSKIYFLCSKMNFSPKYTRYVIAITNYGLYVYQREGKDTEEIQLFCSWHHFLTLDFETRPGGGVFFEKKLFKYYTWEILHLLHNLKRELVAFFENPPKVVNSSQNKESNDYENDKQLANKEVNQINEFYRRSKESKTKNYLHILDQGYKTFQAKKLIEEKHNDLLMRIESLEAYVLPKEEKIEKSDIAAGIFCVLLGLFLFIKFGWFWKIIGIIEIASGIGVIYEKNKNSKKKNELANEEAKKRNKELDEFYSIFHVKDNKIFKKDKNNISLLKGTWECSCGFTNVKSNNSCTNCGKKLTEISGVKQRVSKNEWICPSCGKIHQSYVGTCGCGQVKPK